jgi:hypothetical protein
MTIETDDERYKAITEAIRGQVAFQAFLNPGQKMAVAMSPDVHAYLVAHLGKQAEEASGGQVNVVGLEHVNGLPIMVDASLSEDEIVVCIWREFGDPNLN